MKEAILQKEYFRGGVISTVYFGGGTPSLLSGEEIKKQLDNLKSIFPVNEDAEITLEANPDDLTREKLESLRMAGVNRLSIGIQSFDDEDLKWMNRAHSAVEAIESVKLSQEAGFDNITIDLIYGTPLLTDEQWKKNLHTAFELNVQHLSCYALTVEPRTALAHSIASRKQAGVEDSKQAKHFGILMEMAAQNNFEHYEISNFARAGYRSKHNSSYWLGEKYLGIGPSAHSFNGALRQWNIRNNHEYIRIIRDGKIPAETETLTMQNKFNEYVMVSIRTMWGCDPEKIRKDFGADYAEKFLAIAAKKTTEGLMRRRDQYFVLTDQGKFFADSIASEFFVV